MKRPFGKKGEQRPYFVLREKAFEVAETENAPKLFPIKATCVESQLALIKRLEKKNPETIEFENQIELSLNLIWAELLAKDQNEPRKIPIIEADDLQRILAAHNIDDRFGEAEVFLAHHLLEVHEMIHCFNERSTEALPYMLLANVDLISAFLTDYIIGEADSRNATAWADNHELTVKEIEFVMELLNRSAESDESLAEFSLHARTEQKSKAPMLGDFWFNSPKIDLARKS